MRRPLTATEGKCDEAGGVPQPLFANSPAQSSLEEMEKFGMKLSLGRQGEEKLLV